MGSKNSAPVGGYAFKHAAAVAARRLGPNSDANVEERAVLQHCYERVALVLAGRIDPAQAGNVLQAAVLIADAIAGPQQIKLTHSLADDHAQLVFAAVGPDPRKLEQARQQLGGPQLVVPAAEAEVAGVGAATVDGSSTPAEPDAA